MLLGSVAILVLRRTVPRDEESVVALVWRNADGTSSEPKSSKLCGYVGVTHVLGPG